jgi:hypothetical protein
MSPNLGLAMEDAQMDDSTVEATTQMQLAAESRDPASSSTDGTIDALTMASTTYNTNIAIQSAYLAQPVRSDVFETPTKQNLRNEIVNLSHTVQQQHNLAEQWQAGVEAQINAREGEFHLVSVQYEAQARETTQVELAQ